MLRSIFFASVIASAAGASAYATNAAEDEITGRTSVVDGDTIDLAGHRIRLDGIDAPESWQRCQDHAGSAYSCGRDAAFALDNFLAKSRPTTCRFVSWDRYGRMVADCFRADGKVVNQWLVRQGWAIDWVRYSHGEFAADQDAAKAERKGIWQGTFQLPCEARAARMKRAPAC